MRSEEYRIEDLFSSRSGQALRRFLSRASGCAPGAGSLEDFERELHERMMALESELLAEHLERFDVEAEEIEVDGERLRFKMKSEREYCGLSGTFKIERSLYVPRSREGKSVCPLDLQAGIVEGTWTPLATRVMALAVQGSTPKEAARLFAEMAGMKPSTSTLDRIPKRLSEKWEAKREAFESELRSQETIPAEATTVIVSLDAVKVPMKDGGRKEKRSQDGKLPKGPSGFKDVTCGEISFYDEEGERLETYRYGRMPESKRRTLRSELLAELQSILAVRPDLRVVGLSDGAVDNWYYLREIFEELGLEEAIEILDFFHAMERIKEALDAVHGEGTEENRRKFQECRIWLRECQDGVERVIRALKYRQNKVRGHPRKVVESAIRYLKKHKARMRYKQHLDDKLPIGSGIIEATCKTLVSERMKRSGMSWLQEGGQAILTLRSLVQSNRYERAWSLLSAQYRSPVRVTKPRSASPEKAVA